MDKIVYAWMPRLNSIYVPLLLLTRATWPYQSLRVFLEKNPKELVVPATKALLFQFFQKKLHAFQEKKNWSQRMLTTQPPSRTKEVVDSCLQHDRVWCRSISFYFC
jgi:hypothetical protein